MSEESICAKYGVKGIGSSSLLHSHGYSPRYSHEHHTFRDKYQNVTYLTVNLDDYWDIINSDDFDGLVVHYE